MTVDASTVERFADAIGESARELSIGDQVPPTFPVTLTWDVQNDVLNKHPLGLGLGLHGEQGFAYHRPILIGDTLTPRAKLQSVRVKGKHTAVTCRTELHDNFGLVCSQLFTLIQIGHSSKKVGELEPLELDPGNLETKGPTSRLTESVSRDQAILYAKASGDDYRIHIDDKFAREEGLAGVILHGMCTMAFAARAISQLRVGGYKSLSFLAVRFSQPVRPGETLTTVVTNDISSWQEHQAGSFFTENQGGVPVLTRGRFRFTETDFRVSNTSG